MKKTALTFGLVLAALALLWQFNSPGSLRRVRAVSPRPGRALEENAHLTNAPVPAEFEAHPAQTQQRVDMGSASSIGQEGRVLRGQVLSSVTLKPVHGASVRAGFILGANDVPFASSLTDSDGRYTIDLAQLPRVPQASIRIAKVEIVAWAEGYHPSTEDLSLATLIANPPALDFRLEPGFTLRGRILKPTGEPAVGAHLMSVTEMGESSSSVRGYRTHGDGEFVISWKTTPPSFLTAKLQGFTQVRLDLRDRDLTVNADLGDLLLGWGGAIEGRILCAGGTPLAGAEVVARTPVPIIRSRSAGILRSWRVITDEAGYFKLEGLVGEEFTIGFGGGTLGPGAPGGFESTFTANRLALTVTVEDEHGEPLVGERIEATFGDMEEGEFRVGDYGRGVSEEPNGKLVLWLDSYSEVLLAVELSGEHILRQRFALTPGACHQEITFVLPEKPPLGQLSVALIDPWGAPIRDVSIALYSSLDGTVPRRLEGSGPHGVMAGSYFARVSTSDARYKDCAPVVIPALEIAVGEELPLQCQLEIGGSIEIEIIPRVTGPHKPAQFGSFARVKAYNSIGDVFALSFITDGGGQTSNGLQLEEPCRSTSLLAPGVYTFEVTVSDCDPVKVQASITPGGVTPLTVEVFRRM